MRSRVRIPFWAPPLEFTRFRPGGRPAPSWSEKVLWPRRSSSGPSRTSTSARSATSTTARPSLTAAISKYLALQRQGRVPRVRLDRQRPRGARARDHDRDRPRRVRDRRPALRPHRLPRARRLHQEHDHRRRPDGRRDPRRRRDRRPDAPDPRAHPARPPGRRAVHRRVPQQGRHGRRPGAARPRRARAPRAADQVRLPGRRHPDHPRLRAQGARGPRQPRRSGLRPDPGADGRARRLHPRPRSARSTSRS